MLSNLCIIYKILPPVVLEIKRGIGGQVVTSNHLPLKAVGFSPKKDFFLDSFM
jgi:hypothetical protein